MTGKSKLPRRESHEQRAIGYWVSSGLVWANASRSVQRDMRELFINTRESHEAFTAWIWKHSGSGKIPPASPRLVIPLVDPKFIPCAIASMQAYTIEIFLKAALVRAGAKVREMHGHELSERWQELQKMAPGVWKACTTDFRGRLAAAEQAGYRPSEKDDAPLPIKRLLKRHDGDFVKFRYGQDGENTKQGQMPQSITVKDRLPLFLFIQTLEHVVAKEQKPLTTEDKEEVLEVGRSVALCFAHGRFADEGPHRYSRSPKATALLDAKREKSG